MFRRFDSAQTIAVEHLTEMTNVMNGRIVEGFNIEKGVCRHAKLFARLIGFPFRISYLGTAASVNNCHDFGRSCIKGEHGIGQNDPNTFAAAVCHEQAMTDTFPRKINIGFFDDAHLIELAH